MSDSLPLADHLLSRGRLLLRVGRPADALRLFRQVLVHTDLPNQVRADALRLLAGIDLEAGRFRRARRSLAAAIRLRRHAGDLYVEFARAVLADPDGDPRRAVKALRRAAAIDPFEPRTWAALGGAALRAGDAVPAGKAFRRAARLRPDRVETLSEIVDGFIALGREGDARDVLTAARFRAPRDAEVSALWDRFRFKLALRQQRQTAGIEDTILPFPVREREASATPAAAVVLRADRKSVSTPHLLRLFGRRADPRRAQ